MKQETWGSECCGAEMEETPEEIVKTSPSVTSYYRNRCLKCKELCHKALIGLKDSAGVEVKYGDILECPEIPKDHSCRYHAVALYGVELDIRDLGCNNSWMWEEPFYNIGPYWKNLDKLTDEDLEHYWDTTREEALKKLAEGDSTAPAVCLKDKKATDIEFSNFIGSKEGTEFINKAVTKIFGELSSNEYFELPKPIEEPRDRGDCIVFNLKLNPKTK